MYEMYEQNKTLLKYYLKFVRQITNIIHEGNRKIEKAKKKLKKRYGRNTRRILILLFKLLFYPKSIE